MAGGPLAGSRVSESARRDGRTVLIVDDDLDTREMLRLLLEINGWTVLTAQSGEEGLERLRQQYVTAIVLDNRMPGMSGLDVAARLREARHPARVVFVTGADDVGEEVRRLGLPHYLRKPIDPPRLLSILEGDN